MLLSKGIEALPPEVHKRTYEAFKKAFIDSGLLDARLLMIYQELIVRAEVLLGVYREEKRKRGMFTYNTIPQANKPPAEESIGHAKMFLKHCSAFLSN